MKILKIGLPKGSLQETTFEILRKAGYRISVSSRSYFPYINDEELQPVLLRAQEIAKYVENGTLDAGITGKDWIEESNAKVVEIGDFIYAKQGMRPVRWVVAVPQNSKIKSIKDLNNKKIATELVNYTKRYLKKHKIKADVEFSWGATEIKTPLLVDAIVELTETGSSLRANKLREVATILESTTRLIMNKKAYKDKWKRRKVEDINLLIQSVLNAEGKVGLKLNVKKENLKKIIKLLPALDKPTISNLSDSNYYAVETIINKDDIIKLIPKIKKSGGSGIVEYPLNKVIY